VTNSGGEGVGPPRMEAAASKSVFSSGATAAPLAGEAEHGGSGHRSSGRARVHHSPAVSGWLLRFPPSVTGLTRTRCPMESLRVAADPVHSAKRLQHLSSHILKGSHIPKGALPDVSIPSLPRIRDLGEREERGETCHVRPWNDPRTPA
jgi:hypothetical protein